jgi:hypothetical protein
VSTSSTLITREVRRDGKTRVEEVKTVWRRITIFKSRIILGRDGRHLGGNATPPTCSKVRLSDDMPLITSEKRSVGAVERESCWSEGGNLNFGF